jgi:hypothetical protein
VRDSRIATNPRGTRITTPKGKGKPNLTRPVSVRNTNKKGSEYTIPGKRHGNGDHECLTWAGDLRGRLTLWHLCLTASREFCKFMVGDGTVESRWHGAPQRAPHEALDKRFDVGRGFLIAPNAAPKICLLLWQGAVGSKTIPKLLSPAI